VYVIKQNIIKFRFIAILSIIITLIFAQYVVSIVYNGKNSLYVYNALKEQKVQLQNNIKYLQLDNARLQKEYFELKNLEPE